MTARQTLEIRRRATTTEAAAEDLLRETIKPWATGDSVWGDFPIMSRNDYASTAMLNNMIRVMLCGMMQTAIGRMSLVEIAKEGYGPAIDFLSEALAEYQSRGGVISVQPLPTELAAYAQWVAVYGRPKPMGGPAKMSHFVRDLGVALAVKHLLHTFPQIKFRGRSMRTKSACHLASKVLGEFGIGMTETNVRKVYQKLLPHLPAHDELNFILGKSE